MTNRNRAWLHSLCMLSLLWLGGLPSCADECVTKTGNPSGHCAGLPGTNEAIGSLAEECGVDVHCDGPGLSEGNAAISGVGSIDRFFASVLRFEAEADRQSAALQAELDGIAGIFGIEAGSDVAAVLRERIEASVEGELHVRAGMPTCAADSDAALTASMQCEGGRGTPPPSAEAACRGRCALPLDGALECDGEGELACTFFAGGTACTGACRGTCTIDGSAASACAGVCRGTCSGACSLYSDAAATQCAGHCDGVCGGSCEIELPQAASCEGACSGECTVASGDGRCDGASHAFCEAAPNAAVSCAGRCEGELEVPAAKAECAAAINAEAKMNVQCTTPRVAIDYQLKSGLDAEARAQFELGMRMLQQRLPYLLMTLARAEQTSRAGADLVGEASSTLQLAVDSMAAGADLRVLFGLRCALDEADHISTVVDSAAGRLSASMDGAAEVTDALGLQVVSE